MTNAVILKPGVCQNIAVHALPTARNILLVLIFAFLIRLLERKKKKKKISKPSQYVLTSLISANAVSRLVWIRGIKWVSSHIAASDLSRFSC